MNLLQGSDLEDVWKESGADLEQVWQESGEALAADNVQKLFEQAYQDQMEGKPVDMEKIFREAFGEQNAMFNNAWDQVSRPSPADQPYELAENNPYNSEENPYLLGLELFEKGELQRAILAFQAAIEKDPAHADAWHMLGVTHQESDEDRAAIQCLEQAIEQDPYHLKALLGLGVSYVNELDQERALKNLKMWVQNNPKFAGIEVGEDVYGDGSGDLMHDVMMLMSAVEQHAPNDPDVQEVLGVLYNVSRDYDRAVAAFKAALNHRPDDYALWNKLGATLANSSRSEEALPNYTRALELKPRYARGWLNYGISYANMGDYKRAASSYLRAIELSQGSNGSGNHIWNYLRICLTCLDGYTHLIPEVESRNLEAFRKVFDF